MTVDRSTDRQRHRQRPLPHCDGHLCWLRCLAGRVSCSDAIARKRLHRRRLRGTRRLQHHRQYLLSPAWHEVDQLLKTNVSERFTLKNLWTYPDKTRRDLCSHSEVQCIHQDICNKHESKNQWKCLKELVQGLARSTRQIKLRHFTVDASKNVC